jgi:hypothetical protein
MAHRLVNVVKKKQVSVSGKVRLGLEDFHTPVRTHGAPAQANGHASGAQPGQQARQNPQTSQNAPGSQPQQVRIVESNSEYAIIEVTCSCGSKSYIQCNYADVFQAGQTLDPNQNAPQQGQENNSQNSANLPGTAAEAANQTPNQQQQNKPQQNTSPGSGPDKEAQNSSEEDPELYNGHSEIDKKF